MLLGYFRKPSAIQVKYYLNSRGQYVTRRINGLALHPLSTQVLNNRLPNRDLELIVSEDKTNIELKIISIDYLNHTNDGDKYCACELTYENTDTHLIFFCRQSMHKLGLRPKVGKTIYFSRLVTTNF